MKTIGDRKEVVSGQALKTRSGLTIKDFVRKKDGRWVYKKKSNAAKKRWNNNPGLQNAFANGRAEPFSGSR